MAIFSSKLVHLHMLKHERELRNYCDLNIITSLDLVIQKFVAVVVYLFTTSDPPRLHSSDKHIIGTNMFCLL